MRWGLVSAGLFVAIILSADLSLANSAPASVGVGESTAPSSLSAPSSANTAISSASSPSAMSVPAPSISSTETRVAIEDLPHWSGNIYQTLSFSTRVMRDNDEWSDFWKMARQRPPAMLPHDKMAVAVILGRRPTEGYSVRLVDVKKDGDNFIISYIENRASRTDRSAGGVSVPWVVQLLPLTDGRVRFMQIAGAN